MLVIVTYFILELKSASIIQIVIDWLAINYHWLLIDEVEVMSVISEMSDLWLKYIKPKKIRPCHKRGELMGSKIFLGMDLVWIFFDSNCFEQL